MRKFLTIILVLIFPLLLGGCWVTDLPARWSACLTAGHGRQGGFSVRKPNRPDQTQAVHRYPMPPRPRPETRARVTVRPTLFNYEVAWSARTDQFVLTTTPPEVKPLQRAHRTRVAVTVPGSISWKVKPAHKTEPGKTRSSQPAQAKPKEIIHFSFGSAAIRPPEKKRIRRIAARINKEHGARVSVTGYTCWIGPRDVNDKLALARAMAVVHELGRHGVKVGSVSARAKCCYIDLKHPAPNRRAEITWERR